MSGKGFIFLSKSLTFGHLVTDRVPPLTLVHTYYLLTYLLSHIIVGHTRITWVTSFEIGEDLYLCLISISFEVGTVHCLHLENTVH